MVLKADQERVMTLLRDTITLLCRNGLNFQSQFCVDAVIGVTVDQDDLFYVSVKEVVKSDKARPPDDDDKSDASEDSSSGGEGVSSEHRRKRRKKKRVKTEAPGSEDNGEQEASPNKRVCVKQEAEEEEDPEDEDIVFIKQELDDNSWSQDASQSYGEYQNSGMAGGGGMQPADQNFSSLSDMTLVPMADGGGGPQGGNMWPPQQQQQRQRQYVPRGPRTSTITSPGSTQDPSQQQYPQQQQPGGVPGDPSQQPGPGGQQQDDRLWSIGRRSIFRCSYCHKIFHEKKNLARHEDRHTGKTKFKCRFCHKGFFNARDLQGHEAYRHLNQKGFHCEYCDKSYSLQHNLMYHVRLKHPTMLNTDEDKEQTEADTQD